MSEDARKKSLPTNGATPTNKPPNGLEDRLRRETDSFRFDTLLGGVSETEQEKVTSKMDSPVQLVTVTQPTSKPAPFGVARTVGWIVAAVATLAGGFSLSYFLVPSVLNHNDMATAPSSALMASEASSPIDPAANSHLAISMPDPALTPGDLMPGGVAAPLPSVPTLADRVQEQVMAAYGITGEAQDRYVMAYLIPPSLGGTSKPANLFPLNPAFLDVKTRLDQELTRLVAAGQITPEEARAELQADWVHAADRHAVRRDTPEQK